MFFLLDDESSELEAIDQVEEAPKVVEVKSQGSS